MRRAFVALPVTTWLIVANVVVFAVTALQSSSLTDNYGGSALFADTALYAPLVGAGEAWRLLTSAFQHFGPMHLFANMWMLLIVGLGIERGIGSGRFAAIYLTSIAGGALGAVVFTPGSLVAGASGGLFGLLGGWIVLASAFRLGARGAMVLVAINIGFSLIVPGISLAGHLGGLAGGALAAAVLVLVPRFALRRGSTRARIATGWSGWAVVTLALLLGGYLAAGG